VATVVNTISRSTRTYSTIEQYVRARSQAFGPGASLQLKGRGSKGGRVCEQYVWVQPTDAIWEDNGSFRIAPEQELATDTVCLNSDGTYTLE